MPIKEMTLTYYKIKTMGLYINSGGVAKQNLKAKDLMGELMEWGHGPIRKFIETSTYSDNSKYLKAYCLDFYEDNGEYIVALWNSVPTSKNGFASVSAKSSSLGTVVQHTKVGKDDIPGFPTFFFVSPEKKCIATIKLDNHVLGISQFKLYIKGYLRGFCSHIVDRVEEGYTIQGLCVDTKPETEIDNRFPDKGVYPSFKIAPFTDVLSEDYLLNNAHNITKVIKDVSTEDLLVDSNESSIEQFLRFMKGIPITKKKTTRLSVPATLTKSHVKKLINDYRDNDCSSEYNVGFVFKGEGQKIHWLSGTAVTNSTAGYLTMLSAERPELKSLMNIIKNLDHSKILSKEATNVT
ncbi:MAG: hypothetical protein ACJA2G_000734 [Cognaticolwellia sp.]|jgi:hypothetical protein